MLVIDHDLGFITNICDRITVLDQGAVLAGHPGRDQRSTCDRGVSWLGHG
ncbi:MAG: hypothetical protein R2713_06530 [Ilumatobacteraceae bacterium]